MLSSLGVTSSGEYPWHHPIPLLAVLRRGSGALIGHLVAGDLQGENRRPATWRSNSLLLKGRGQWLIMVIYYDVFRVHTACVLDL